MFTCHSLYPKITLSTRLSNNHGTLIDNIFCKLTETTLDNTSGISIKKTSDHQPYFTLLNNVIVKDFPLLFGNITNQDKEILHPIS